MVAALVRSQRSVTCTTHQTLQGLAQQRRQQQGPQLTVMPRLQALQVGKLASQPTQRQMRESPLGSGQRWWRLRRKASRARGAVV